MKNQKPSDLEMQILSLLWDKGASTAREVLDAMPDGKKRAYTTVLSVLQVMEKKGLLTHTNRGLAHVYSPAASKSTIIQPFMQKLIDEVFGGRPTAMMQALLTETSVSSDELDQIRTLLDSLGKSEPQESERQV